ncbi:PKD domain-containing protein [Geomonas subterranea]|uniref:PKD domain-containing protein n=1 Tax=Geomonas subterranea TaxID=2847989 RepID=UPI001CD4228A|nr:PKD domain-containing protein [Geomonas fuzhouensis]
MSKIVGTAAGLLVTLLLVVTAPLVAEAAHPKPGEYGARGMLFNPAMLGIPLLDYFNAAPIMVTGPAVNGRYSGLPPFGTKASCNLCHFDIVANENMNRHATMSFNKITWPQYGYGYDKEKPWMSGPGKFGKWSPFYNRQLGNMKATYATKADILTKLDMGAFEFTTECGVCHVGGGPGTSNPYNFTFPWRVSDYFGYDRGAGGIHSNLDNEQRNQSIANDYIFPLPLNSPYYPRRVPLNPWDFFVNDEGTVKSVDWASWGMNGTMQMDCLMCHLQGYDHLGRNQEIVRYQRLYNAGTVGSGIATVDPSGGEGFSMNYDASMLKVGSDGTLYLDSSFTDRITRSPRADNCVHCHMPTAVKNQPYVDWKARFYSYDAVPSDDPANPGNLKPARYLSDLVKRGDIWSKDEVHLTLECAGCHTQTGKYQAWKPTDPNYMHSPGKGYDPMSTGSDEFGGTVKFCYDCHVLAGDLNGDGVKEIDIIGAPNPNYAHKNAGLMINIVPKARRIDSQGGEVEFTGNHLDVIACTSCHVRKRYAAGRSVDFSTGSQFFNMVGNPLDQENGSVDVDIAFSWKETTPVKLLPNGSPNPLWRRLIYPFNYVTGIYWDNIGSKDANGDGFTTGMSNNGKVVSGDPFFQRNVKENFSYGLNGENDRVPTGLAGSTVFDSQSLKNAEGGVVFSRPAEIEAYKAKVTGKDAGMVPQLVLESEPYLLMHNIAQVGSYALGRHRVDGAGKKVYGCSDCHGASGGIFNGTINMLGKGKRPDNTETPLTVQYNSGSDVLTKALYWDRTGVRKSFSFADTASSPKRTRDAERREFLGYDTARVAALNAPQDPALFGMEVDPKAVVDPVADADATILGVQVVTGSVVQLSCPPGQYLDANGNGRYDSGETLVGTVTYQWSASDGSAITGNGTRNAGVTFTGSGDRSITLTVTDEEGKVSTASATVTVIPPPISISWNPDTDTATFTSFPAGTVSAKVYWGDGLSTTRSGAYFTDPLVMVHRYSTATQKTIKIYCYNSGGTQVGYMQKTVTP